MWPVGIPRRRRFIPPPAATTEVKTKVELPRDRARRQRLETASLGLTCAELRIRAAINSAGSQKVLTTQVPNTIGGTTQPNG